jgi:hypothetical protein
MSDSREGVNEAVRQNRLLLAKLQVRDDDLVKEIEALTAERATATGELREALGAKIAALEGQRRTIAVERDQVLAELGALDTLKGKLPAIEAQALAREALAFTGADPGAAPPVGRMSEEEARAQLAALKAQRAGAKPDGDEKPADAAPDDPRPPKRTL